MSKEKGTSAYDIILLILTLLLIISFLINLPISYYQIVNQKARQTNFFNLLQPFLFIVDLALIIMLNILVFNLYSAIKRLNVKENVFRKIFLGLHIIEEEPSIAFFENAPRDRNGTFLYSYDDYRRFHDLSRKTMKRAVFLFFLQMITLGFLIFSVASFTIGNSSNPLEHQSGKFKLKQLNSYQ